MNTDQIRAVIFDKDGTLVDFHQTWDPAVGLTLEMLTGQLGQDPPEQRRELQRAADALGYNLAQRRVEPDSPVIAESNDVLIALLEPLIAPLSASVLASDKPFGELFNQCGSEALLQSTTAASGAHELLTLLQQHQIPAAVATNDSKHAARLQVEILGWTSLFASVVGYDSGFGAKPDPGMVLASAQSLGVAPRHCLMVGDSNHDIDAGTAAGMMTALLTSSPSTAATTAPRHIKVASLHGLFDLFRPPT